MIASAAKSCSDSLSPNDPLLKLYFEILENLDEPAANNTVKQTRAANYTPNNS